MYNIYFTSVEKYLSLSQIKSWMDVTKKTVEVFIGKECTRIRFSKKEITCKLVSIIEYTDLEDKVQVKFTVKEQDQYTDKIWKISHTILLDREEFLEDYNITIKEKLNMDHVEKYIKTNQTIPYTEWLEKMGHMKLGKDK